MSNQKRIKSISTVRLTQKVGFDELPDNAFVREAELIRSESNPLAPLPFSTHTLWRKVKDGSFPAPLKLASRVTAWHVKAVRAWMTECLPKAY